MAPDSADQVHDEAVGCYRRSHTPPEPAAHACPLAAPACRDIHGRGGYLPHLSRLKQLFAQKSGELVAWICRVMSVLAILFCLCLSGED
jgi:hypothetical protein